MATQKASIAVDPRATRVRTGVWLVIIADAMFVASILASELYLAALNVMGQFKPAAEQTPSLLGATSLTLIAIASALVYGWAARGFTAGDQARFETGARVALILVAIALLGQIVFLATLNFRAPLHGYGSMTILTGAYHAVHLLLTAILGALVLGRLANGRLMGQGYLAEVLGYWWYFVAVVAVAFWLVGLIASS